MAHELTANRLTGAIPMAFTGRTPWHGLGQQLTEGASLDTWTQEAGFNWEAYAAPVQFTSPDGTQHTMPGRKVIYRSDTSEAISVMGDGYNIVQPGEVMEFFRDAVESNGWHMETAGILGNGSKMWALARNGHSGDVVPGDRVSQYLMLATSLDGTTATTAAFTNVRVVCANTLGQAMRNIGKGALGKNHARVSHRSQFDADAIKAHLGLAAEQWDGFMSRAQALAAKGCTLAQARDILRGIFGKPVAGKADPVIIAPAPAVIVAPPTPAQVAAESGLLASLLGGSYTPKVDTGTEARDELARLLSGPDGREQRSVARTLALFAGEGRGANHDGVAGTMWGLLNAVTEHVDHEMGRTDETRLQSAWFGRGDAFKQSALTALLAA